MPTKATGQMRELARVKGSRGVLLSELSAVALKLSGPDPDRRTDVLHPSEMAKLDWCWRASYFRITTGKLPDPEKFSLQMQTIFLEGNWAHDKYQYWMRKTGKLWGDWKCHLCATLVTGFDPPIIGCRNPHGHMWKYMEVSLDNGLVAGHEDGAMCDPSLDALAGYMVEIKTLGLGSIRIDSKESLEAGGKDYLSKYYVELADGGMIYDLDSYWKDFSRPLGSHVRQANIYLWLAQELGLPFHTVRFIYEFKANQATKEFSIPYSARIMEPILTGIRAVEYALAHGEPPACPHGGCKVCSAYHELLGMKDADEAEKPAGNRARRRSPGVSGGEGAAGAVPRAGSVRRRGHPDGPGDRPEPVGEAPGAGTPRGPRRRVRGPGPGTDAAVHQPVPVDEVPDGSGVRSSGRRIVRRKATGSGDS